jgi:hypothetical protein
LTDSTRVQINVAAAAAAAAVLLLLLLLLQELTDKAGDTI